MDLHELHQLFLSAGLALLIVSILIGILIGMVSPFLRARAARKWPQARGTIIRSEMVSELRSDGPDDPEIITYPVVEYAYEVDGSRYQSRQLSIVVGATPGPGPAELVATYPKGSTLPVFYNPANHADSALDCRVPAKVAARTFKAAAILFVIGLVCIFAFTPAASLLHAPKFHLRLH